MSALQQLEKLWLASPEGKLRAREQAKAWALRETWVAEGKGQHGLYSFVASRVQKTKDGKPLRQLDCIRSDGVYKLHFHQCKGKCSESLPR